MTDTTIIYYTSNIEEPEFEQKIIEQIEKVRGDVPVISVSQKPLDFGENICVGDVGYSYVNAFRQCLIGAEKATTKYVIMAESDCLYPSTGYFDFVPTDDGVIYNYHQVWILWKKPRIDTFRRKYQTHGSVIYNREFLISFLKKILVGLPEWTNQKLPLQWYPNYFKFIEFGSEYPIINVITGANGRGGTALMDVPKQASLPYWGSSIELKNKLFKK